MSLNIKFGTDGWRGIIAREFTFDNVRLCAQSMAEYIHDSGMASRGLLIGYDNRFASEDFAAATAEVVAANNIKVYLCSKTTPTPVISFGILDKKTAGAVIITASHNSAEWNGFKLKSHDGTSAPTEMEASVEGRIPEIAERNRVKVLPLENALQQGIVEYIDLAPDYIQHLSKLVDIESIRQSRLKVMVDPMYGAGIGYFKGILSGGSIQVEEINGERNPLFPGIQPEPIARNLTKLSRMITERGIDVGLANDGDADRLGVVDEKGEFRNTLEVFALLALYLLDTRGEQGAIIKTVTSSSMLYKLGEIYHVPVLETPVGFKYVGPLMMSENALIGGEESGGYGFRGNVPERDGILAGLYFLDFMIRTGKTPSQLIDWLFSIVGPHYYYRTDFEFPHEQRAAIMERMHHAAPEEFTGTKVVRIDTTDGFHFVMSDGSWLLVRFSGTEPVLRIYAEGTDMEKVKALVESGKSLAGV